jgi:hypothetical protein
MKRKCLAIGMILSFLTIGFSPITIANDNTSLSNVSPVPETGTEIYKDVNCQVSGIADCVFGYYFLLSFGTSFFTQFRNGYPHDDNDLIKSYDAVDFISGKLYFRSEGEHGYAGGYFSGRIIMKDFVGFFYRGFDRHMKPVRGFDGFASSVKAIGSPLT